MFGISYDTVVSMEQRGMHTFFKNALALETASARPGPRAPAPPSLCPALPSMSQRKALRLSCTFTSSTDTVTKAREG